MDAARLAVWLDAYRAPLKDALRQAAADGFHVVEANAASDELDPSAFGRSARQHLRRYLRDLHLELGAVSLDYPGGGLSDPRFAEQRLDRCARTLQFCADLGGRQTGVTLGGFDDPRTGALARELVGEVAKRAQRTGVTVALQPALEDPQAAAGVIRGVACPELRLGIDLGAHHVGPQTLVRLCDLLANVRLRDVRRAGEFIEEVPFGQGQVELPAILEALRDHAYAGLLTVRRDAAQPAIDALRQAREYSASLIGRLAQR